jgi:hypothetical protein
MRAAVLSVLMALVLAGPAIATDLPLNPARPAPAATIPAPASAHPLTSPDATCLEWTDGCRVCQRAANGEVSCSNVGIACVAKAQECTRR